MTEMDSQLILSILGDLDELQALVDARIKAIYKRLTSIEGGPVAATPLEKFALGVRSYNCLTRSGFKTKEQVDLVSDKELLDLRNLGERCLREIRIILAGGTQADVLAELGPLRSHEPAIHMQRAREANQYYRWGTSMSSPQPLCSAAGIGHNLRLTTIWDEVTCRSCLKVTYIKPVAHR